MKTDKEEQPLFIIDGINDERIEAKTFDDFTKIVHEYIDSDEGIHPDIEMIELYQRVGYVKVTDRCFDKYTATLKKEVDKLKSSLFHAERFRIEDASSAINEANQLRDKIKTLEQDKVKAEMDFAEKFGIWLFQNKDRDLIRKQDAHLVMEDYLKQYLNSIK